MRTLNNQRVRGQTLPDLTTDQAVQWVGRHVPTLYENLLETEVAS